ncbi:hypothetical protein EVAR_10570_1 [Eumeta japonica]|uniref:Mariner Mos1 transposase n=1 Tax=Eumeta variegata TaxID=151549 RepID=A0A4C1U1Z9_EUMVA|nr:hypothetical protein EVAR_10570_1 [Eumeta japonica]
MSNKHNLEENSIESSMREVRAHFTSRGRILLKHILQESMGVNSCTRRIPGKIISPAPIHKVVGESDRRIPSYKNTRCGPRRHGAVCCCALWKQSLTDAVVVVQRCRIPEDLPAYGTERDIRSDRRPLSMTPKQSSDPTYGYYVLNENPNKLAYDRRASQADDCFFFFNITRQVASVSFENCRTVNSYWYTTICLSEVNDELRKSNRKYRIFLHHDNASSHTAKQTNNFLEEKNVELMSNPAYSLDLASYDFFCSQKLKTNYTVNDFHHQKKLLKSMKKMYPRSPETKGRTNIGIENHIRIESGTGTISGIGTRTDIGKEMMIAIKIDKKIGRYRT